MENKINISADKLRKFAEKIGICAGLNPKDAFILADCLVFANLRGIDSHGIIRLPLYINRLETKNTNARPKIKILMEKGGTVLLDGDNGLGQVIGVYASKLAIKKAKQNGISYIAVNRSSHYGAASYYTCLIAKNNMFGISFSNVPPVMIAWGGIKPAIGNNPFSFASPYKKNQPIVLDIAMSVAAGGKIRLYAKNNKKIPKGWILDKEGKNTDNPKDLEDGGTLLPFGEYKGYGLAVGIEILAGTMTHAGMLSQIPIWFKDMEKPLNIGQCYVAIDISNFMELEKFRERLKWVVTQLKSSPLSEYSNDIFIPGEIESKIENERLSKGIPITENIWNDLIALSKKFNVIL